MIILAQTKSLSESFEIEGCLHVQIWLMLSFYSSWITLKGRIILQIRSCYFPLSCQELKKKYLIVLFESLEVGIVCWVSTVLDFSCSGSFARKTQTCPATSFLHDAGQSWGSGVRARGLYLSFQLLL